MWITNLKFNITYSEKESENNAIDIIKKWAKNNEDIIEVTMLKGSKRNRVISVVTKTERLYFYKLTCISRPKDMADYKKTLKGEKIQWNYIAYLKKLYDSGFSSHNQTILYTTRTQ